MDYKAGWNPTLHLSIQTLFKQLHNAVLHLCLVWLSVETSNTSMYHQGGNTKPEATALFI